MSKEDLNNKIAERLIDILDQMFPLEELSDVNSVNAKKFKLTLKRIIYLNWSYNKLNQVLQYFVDHHKSKYWMPADIINLGIPVYDNYGYMNSEVSEEVSGYTYQINKIIHPLTLEDIMRQKQDEIMKGIIPIPEDWHLDEVTKKYVPNE